MLTVMTVSPTLITVLVIACCLVFALTVLLLFLCGTYIIETPKQLKRIADALETLGKINKQTDQNSAQEIDE